MGGAGCCTALRQHVWCCTYRCSALARWRTAAPPVACVPCPACCTRCTRCGGGRARPVVAGSLTRSPCTTWLECWCSCTSPTLASTCGRGRVCRGRARSGLFVGRPFPVMVDRDLFVACCGTGPSAGIVARMTQPSAPAETGLGSAAPAQSRPSPCAAATRARPAWRRAGTASCRCRWGSPARRSGPAVDRKRPINWVQ